MAKRIKSGIKRVEVAERNRLRNVAMKSAIKTYIRKVMSALEAGQKDEAGPLAQRAISLLDSSVTKGILHRNTVARRKSRLMLAINKAQKPKPAKKGTGRLA
ncbi:MAG: 30S ribosomal protein S20 [Nevskia sp.]|nr:30S ribosomal protein S20 [Nevskia sp.]